MCMSDVKVLQIGLGSFGRHGFDDLVGMVEGLDEVSMELIGVADRDPEALEKAERFAEQRGLEIETWRSVEEAYNAAEGCDEPGSRVLVYDAGPSDLHFDHIVRSMRNDFYHLAEKPPSMTREQHIAEKHLQADSEVRFMVDFIERENPVVLEALKLVEDAESVEVFRESSIGVEKIEEPIDRLGVTGGCVLDKMSHEEYVQEFTEIGELEELEKTYMPFDRSGEALMDVHGSKTRSVGKLAAEGKVKACFSGGVTLHASWLGVSEEAENAVEGLDIDPINTEIRTSGGKAFSFEEARFFIVRGERDLLGDMLNERLVDLDSGERVGVPDRERDQLYRALRSAVKEAAGIENRSIEKEDISRFMNKVFDVKEAGGGEALEEASEGLEWVEAAELENAFEDEEASL